MEAQSVFLVTQSIEADKQINNLTELDCEDSEKQEDAMAQTKILLNDETDLAKCQTAVSPNSITFQ